jgi:hypothetical protein
MLAALARAGGVLRSPLTRTLNGRACRRVDLRHRGGIRRGGGRRRRGVASRVPAVHTAATKALKGLFNSKEYTAANTARLVARVAQRVGHEHTRVAWR